MYNGRMAKTQKPKRTPRVRTVTPDEIHIECERLRKLAASFKQFDDELRTQVFRANLPIDGGGMFKEGIDRISKYLNKLRLAHDEHANETMYDTKGKPAPAKSE